MGDSSGWFIFDFVKNVPFHISIMHQNILRVLWGVTLLLNIYDFSPGGQAGMLTEIERGVSGRPRSVARRRFCARPGGWGERRRAPILRPAEFCAVEPRPVHTLATLLAAGVWGKYPIAMGRLPRIFYRPGKSCWTNNLWRRWESKLKWDLN